MSGHYHAIVWIDHREHASFISTLPTSIDSSCTPTTRRATFITRPTASAAATQRKTRLSQRVTDAIADAGAVLVTGPANAKTEFVKHIERHAPALGAKIAGVETIDHPTDGELVAHARKYFKDDHQMEPRVQ